MERSSAAPAAEERASSQVTRHHVHSSYIWLGSLRIVAAAVVVVVAGSLDSFAAVFEIVHEGRGLAVAIAAGVLLAALLVVFGTAIACRAWSYRHLYYELGPEEFSFYKGIFTKKRMHVPYQRVQSVNSKASLLQRLAGVSTVKVDTAGGASNEGITVPYVTKAAAEELRRDLFARKASILSGARGHGAAPAEDVAPVGGNVLDDVSAALEDARGVFGGAEVDTGRISYEYRLTNRELVLSAITSSGSSVAIVIGAFASLVSLALGIAGSLLNEAVTSIGSMGAVAIAVVGIVVSLVLWIVLWLLSVAVSLVSYGGFRAIRRDARVEVEYGLLSRSFHGLDVDRVQSVIVKQGFIRRLFGYCELSLGRIDSVVQGDSGDKNSRVSQGLIVHPFVKLSRVPDILGGLVPEFSDVPVQLVPVADVALRRALVRRCTWCGFGFWLLVAALAVHVGMTLAASAIAAACPGVFAAAYIVAAACIAVDVIGAVLWYRGSGFAYNRDFLRVVNAGFSVKSVMVPRKKIQFGCLVANPLQRRAGVVTIHAKSAAGVGTDIKLVDVAQRDASAWFAWLHPHGNRR